MLSSVLVLGALALRASAQIFQSFVDSPGYANVSECWQNCYPAGLNNNGTNTIGFGTNLFSTLQQCNNIGPTLGEVDRCGKASNPECNDGAEMGEAHRILVVYCSHVPGVASVLPSGLTTVTNFSDDPYLTIFSTLSGSPTTTEGPTTKTGPTSDSVPALSGSLASASNIAVPGASSTSRTSSTSGSSPTSTATPQLQNKSSGLSSGAKVGLGVGLSVGILLLLGILGALFFMRKRRAAGGKQGPYGAVLSSDKSGVEDGSSPHMDSHGMRPASYESPFLPPVVAPARKPLPDSSYRTERSPPPAMAEREPMSPAEHEQPDGRQSDEFHQARTSQSPYTDLQDVPIDQEEHEPVSPVSPMTPSGSRPNSLRMSHHGRNNL